MDNTMKFYVISRASIPERVAMWKELRDKQGMHITSTWIDEAQPGETKNLGELWARISQEINKSDAVMFYVEPEEFPLKGALIEAGMALAYTKPIFLIAPGCTFTHPSYRPIGSWINHHLVTTFDSIEDALTAMQ